MQASARKKSNNLKRLPDNNRIAAAALTERTVLMMKRGTLRSHQQPASAIKIRMIRCQ